MIRIVNSRYFSHDLRTEGSETSKSKSQPYNNNYLNTYINIYDYNDIYPKINDKSCLPEPPIRYSYPKNFTHHIEP